MPEFVEPPCLVSVQMLKVPDDESKTCVEFTHCGGSKLLFHHVYQQLYAKLNYLDDA